VIIELMAFSLKGGADEAAFIAADKRLQAEFAYQQPGMMRRTTARSDNNWIVLDLWDTEEHAEACSQKWDGDPIAAEFMSFVDGATVRSKRYEDLGG
jgi:hypothetical protein